MARPSSRWSTSRARRSVSAFRSKVWPSTSSSRSQFPLAEAVGAAHQRDIVHRDLKPANVLVASDGRIKVLDFGLARLSSASGDEAPTQSWVTGPDVVVGTAPYMSPEQIKGMSVDARSDVFALGAVFYEMLSGERPFVGNSRAEIAAAILERQPTSIGKLGRGVPRPLAEIIERCLEKQPAARFVSAVDVSSALEAGFRQASRRVPESHCRDCRGVPRGGVHRGLAVEAGLPRAGGA